MQKDNDYRMDWLKLDNAAKIFPIVRTSRWNNLYRCCAVLKSKVDRDTLQEAVNVAIKRYPMFQVILRKGIFWYYFQSTDAVPVVKPDENYPCEMLDFKRDKLMFRVLYGRNRISMEFFHSITDGFGAMNFLNTVLLKYFHLQGKKVPCGNLLHYDDIPDEEEFEDAYRRCTRPELGMVKRTDTSAYHIKGTQELPGILNVTMGEIPTDQLKSVAKKLGVSVNDFINAAAAYICYKRRLYDNSPKSKKFIKIQTAVNMRKYMPSRTLRNFSALFNVVLEDNSKGTILTFEEVLKICADYQREVFTEEGLYKFINANTAIEKNFFIRIVPLFIKNFVIKCSYYSVSEKLLTLPLSNMGVIQTPEEFKDYVDRYEFVIGRLKYLNHAITVGTFNNKTVITISRKIKAVSFEREFFRLLAEQGLDVKINSNKE